MIAKFKNMDASRRIVLIAVLLLCTLTVLAEDVTFMTNRRQWEKLPTATLMKMGANFMNTKNLPDSGMLCYTIVANRYYDNLHGEELEQCIRATCFIGTIYRSYYRNQADAYKQILKAKDLAEKHHYDDFVVNTLMELGNLNLKQSGLLHSDDLVNEAITYYKAAFWKAVETKSYRIMPVIMININNITCSQNDFSIFSKERATYNTLSIPDTADLKPICDPINHGVELFGVGEYSQALDVFRYASVESLKTSANNKASLRIMLNEFVYHVQMKMGQQSDALKTLMQGIELVKVEQPEQIAGIYGQLAEFYRLQDNQTLANKYELLWWRTTDSIAQASQVNNVNKAGFLYELDKMNEEQKALNIKHQHDRQMLWVVTGFLMLSLLMLTWLLINRNRIKRKNRILYENNLALLAADEQRRQLDEEQNRAIAEKYGTSRMDEQSAEELWQNIVHVMEYSQEIFDESFNVARLAELIGAKPNYVSQAINQHEGWSFSSLLGHYRIREACRRMNDTANYGGYTIEGIAQSVGYSSRSHFVKLFKKQIGLTPSDYMKEAHNKGGS